MSDLTELIKDNVKALNKMYQLGYDAGLLEGKRQAYGEIKKDLEKINETSKV
jgi:hypothetical protein